MVLAQLSMVHPVVLISGWSSDGWRHMDGWGHMGGWGIGSTLFAALLLLAVVGAVAAAVVALARPRGSDAQSREERPDPEDGARRILAERYARGEIGTEEYRDRLQGLR